MKEYHFQETDDGPLIKIYLNEEGMITVWVGYHLVDLLSFPSYEHASQFIRGYEKAGATLLKVVKHEI